LVGQSVLFPVASTIQIIYNNTTYYIAKEVDIVLIEEPAP
jgi:co-chaperonin GroES (HSP10)